jgi:Methyltransferase domain
VSSIISAYPQDVVDAVNRVLTEISRLPQEWHPAGSYDMGTLVAIARHALTAPIRRSAETGCGATTFILSQISEHHRVFAYMHPSKEVPLAYERGLLNEKRVEFILGATQRTLPPYRFSEPLDFALIDGPHGYPFPELEYFAFYQVLAPGALLIVDDIHIPTIRNLFNFLNEEKMFRLVEVSGKTAFYRRTAEPTFNPEGDDWQRQQYNVRFAPAELRWAVEGQ